MKHAEPSSKTQLPTRKLTMLAVASALLASCGGGSDSNEPLVLEDYDGNWFVDILIAADSSAECFDSSARVELVSGSIAGTVNGEDSRINGSITGEGSIAAGLAIDESGQSFAEFSGNAANGTLRGDWFNNAGCMGSWTARRVDNIAVADYDGDWIVDIPVSSTADPSCAGTSGRLTLSSGAVSGTIGDDAASFSGTLRDDGWIDDGVAFEPGATPYARFHGTVVDTAQLTGRWRYPDNLCFGSWTATPATGAE